MSPYIQCRAAGEDVSVNGLCAVEVVSEVEGLNDRSADGNHGWLHLPH